MSTFDTWLQSLDQLRTVLVEVDYKEGLTEGTLYFSNRPFASTSTDTPASTPYDDIILDGLNYTKEISGLSGGIGLSVGSLILAAIPELIAKKDVQVSGLQIRVYLGDSRWSKSEFSLISILTADSIEPLDRSSYVLKFRNEDPILEETVSQGTFTTGVNAEAKLPVCFGQCLNIKPLQYDDSGLIWTIHDSAITSISDVRVAGTSVAFTADIANGRFTLSAVPDGLVTCDVIGGAGTVPKDILTDVLGRIGVTDIDTDSLDTLPTATVGLYSESGLTPRQIFDSIVNTFGAFWTFTRLGQFKTGLINRPSGNPTAYLTPDDILLDGVRPRSVIQPAKEIELSYRRNHTLQGVTGYEDAYSFSNSKDENISNSYPGAELKIYDAILQNEADATTRSAALLTFFNVPLKTYTIDAFALPFAFELGQEINFSYPFFGFDDGVDATIISITDDPQKGLTKLWILLNG